MKVLLKKEVCGSRKLCTGPTGKVDTRFSKKKKNAGPRRAAYQLYLQDRKILKIKINSKSLCPPKQVASLITSLLIQASFLLGAIMLHN